MDIARESELAAPGRVYPRAWKTETLGKSPVFTRQVSLFRPNITGYSPFIQILLLGLLQAIKKSDFWAERKIRKMILKQVVSRGCYI